MSRLDEGYASLFVAQAPRDEGLAIQGAPPVTGTAGNVLCLSWMSRTLKVVKVGIQQTLDTIVCQM